MLLQSCRWKWKGTTTRYFFKLSKKNLPHACVHNISTFCKWIVGKSKWKNNNITRNSRRSDIFNVINIAECWCKIDFTSEGSLINQSSITQLLVATFSQMALFGLWVTCYVSATCEKVGHMPIFLSFRNSTMDRFILNTTFPSQKFILEEIQLIINC